jgi:hypothetical protein
MTRVFPDSVVLRRTQVTARVSGASFRMRVVDCSACGARLGWHIRGLAKVLGRIASVERSPLTPELVGRFVFVEDALMPGPVRAATIPAPKDSLMRSAVPALVRRRMTLLPPALLAAAVTATAPPKIKSEKMSLPVGRTSRLVSQLS